jgi:peptidoglycan/LPS O-acetylase OafA/YrhL
MLPKLTGPGLFRLFLALLVFVHHASRVSFGSMAVYVFFCLSGFWIYRMYTGRYARTRQPYITYLVSRLWRLMPAYWLITLITLTYSYWTGALAVEFRANNPVHFVLSNVFLLGYDKLLMQPIAPAWSLDIEMQFYLIAPLLAILLARRVMPAVWVLVIVGTISAVSVTFGFYVHLLSCLIFFVIGMVTAANDWKPSRALAGLSVAVPLLLVLACFVSPWRGILLVGTHRGPLSSYTDAANVVLAFLAAPYAMYTTRQKGFAQDDMFGDLSYVIYLLHWPAMIWLGTWLARGGGHRLAVSAAIFIIVIGISILIWRFYDKPINRMRSQWVKTRMLAMKPQEAPVKN